MQIVIDIPDRIYKIVQKKTLNFIDDEIIEQAIKNGTPLHKGHGRLIDVDEVIKIANKKKDLHGAIWNAPTIIETDLNKTENEIPWYMQIFNQDILNEYQKRMRDATPEERQKEVPYDDNGSSIHSEVYKEKQGMVEDRLNKTISDLAYILDSLISLRQIQNIGDCNICKNKDCGYMPKAGQMVRYNCPFYKAESEEI